MVEEKLESLKKTLAMKIICDIVFSYYAKKADFKATRSTIRSDFLVKADEISKTHNINIESYFQEVINSIPVDRKKGVYLPCRKVPQMEIDEIIKEIKALIGERAAKFDQILNKLKEAKLGLELTEWMSGADDYLKRRGETVESVLHDLYNFREANYTPESFEYLIVKALCLIFQLPIFVSYGAEFNIDSEPMVLWRGKISPGNVPETYAPGGASDIIVYLRGRNYLLVEATLRSTRTQWETEIEPIFTHAQSIKKKYNLGSELFICLVTPKLLEQTYERLKTLSVLHNVFYLDVDDLYRISLVSSWIPGLPHHEISKLFKRLYLTLSSSVSFNMYTQSQKDQLKLWCSEITRDFARTFMSIKLYEKLEDKRLMPINDVATHLTNDSMVRDYLRTMGVPEREIAKAVASNLKDYIAHASLLGLLMEINGHIKRLPIDEFVNSIYKLLGLVRKK